MYRILVADDEPIERTVITKKLHQYFPEDVEVFTAENGREAVETFNREKCQIAVLDISMPSMNGLDAAKVIKTQKPEASVIFLTAFDEFAYAKKAIEVKALDYLLKPGNDEELISVLEEAFRIADNNEDTYIVNRMKKDNVEGTKEPVDESSLRMKYFAEDIRNYMVEHYKEDISLQDLAAKVGYSDAYFCKMFKQYFDKSFIMYLNDIRINRAKELLADAGINIKDVSTEAGFREANYFARVFRRATGYSPREYRAKMLEGQ